MKVTIIVGLVLCLLVAVACGPSQADIDAQISTAIAEVPTATPQPTYTLSPTPTPYPTYTPYPTPTHTPAAGQVEIPTTVEEGSHALVECIIGRMFAPDLSGVIAETGAYNSIVSEMLEEFSSAAEDFEDFEAMLIMGVVLGCWGTS